MSTSVTRGSVRHVSMTFTNPFSSPPGEKIDPDTVSLIVKYGDGSSVTYVYGVGGVIVRDAEGEYSADIDLDIVNETTWDWVSTGLGKATAGGSILVKRRNTD